MTPIQPRRSAGPVCEAQPEEALVCRPSDPSLEMCLADSYTAASLPEVPRSEQIRNHYAQQVLDRSRSRILASAFGNPAATSQSFGSPVASSVWGLLSGMSNLACSGHPALNENTGGDGSVGNNDPDRPPQNPNGADGGLGAGINTAFANSACPRPLDLDPSNTAGSALMTCGVNGLGGNPAGVGTAERIDAMSGAVTTLQLPITLGSDSRPVFTTT